MDQVSTLELLQLLNERLKALHAKKSNLEVQLDQKISILAQSQSHQLEVEEEDDETCLDLFSSARMSPSQVIHQLVNQHGFDLIQFVKPLLQKDSLAMARTVNYIRTMAATHIPPFQVILQVQQNANDWQNNDSYLKPFLENDSLLWAYGDEFSLEPEDGEDMDSDDDDDDEDSDDLSSETSQSSKEEQDAYFEGYDSIDIHEEMLLDQVRTLAYKNAIAQNKSALENKLIIDVGSGTGILSLFCATLVNPSKVFAIENCASLSKLSQQLIRCNKEQDRIELFVGKAEAFASAKQNIQVDAIVSEWMGYALLFEHTMLSAVLSVRDACLKPDTGLMFPQTSQLFVHAIVDTAHRISFWDDVYGFDFGLMKAWRFAKVDVCTIDAQALVSPPCTFKHFDFQRMTDKELDFEEDFVLYVDETCTRAVDGLCISFDCTFPVGSDGQPPVVLPTSPNFTPTHWKQSTLWLEEPIVCTPTDREIRGKISFIRRGTSLDIGLRISHPVQLLTVYNM